MKKIISLILVSMIALGLVACSSTNEKDGKGEEDTPKVVRDLKEDNYEVKGDGEFLILSAGGTTEDGNVPVEYMAPDTQLSQIGYEARGFDGSKLSFIYLNGVLQGKEQLSDNQSSLDLEGDFLKPGKYTVEVVQYRDDDPSKEMLTYKTCAYEIKEN